MTTETNRPALRIYQIEERGEGKENFWREVGVAWANKDGSLNLDFAVIPMIGVHTIQARPFTEKKKEANDDDAPASPKPPKKK